MDVEAIESDGEHSLNDYVDLDVSRSSSSSSSGFDDSD